MFVLETLTSSLLGKVNIINGSNKLSLHNSLLKQELLAFHFSVKTEQIMQMLQEIQLFTDL